MLKLMIILIIMIIVIIIVIIVIIVIVILIIVCLLSRPSNAKPRRRPGRAARHSWGHTIAPSGLLSHFAKDGEAGGSAREVLSVVLNNSGSGWAWRVLDQLVRELGPAIPAMDF